MTHRITASAILASIGLFALPSAAQPTKPTPNPAAEIVQPYKRMRWPEGYYRGLVIGNRQFPHSWRVHFYQRWPHKRPANVIQFLREKRAGVGDPPWRLLPPTRPTR